MRDNLSCKEILNCLFFQKIIIHLVSELLELLLMAVSVYYCAHTLAQFN